MADWISTRDELPPYDEMVMCTLDGRGINPEGDPASNKPFNPVSVPGYFKQGRGDRPDYWVVVARRQTYYGCIFGDDIWGTVTAWQPMMVAFEDPDFPPGKKKPPILVREGAS